VGLAIFVINVSMRARAHFHQRVANSRFS